jgi:3-methylcrotonyl-CoA carboxylase alpha subunit
MITGQDLVEWQLRVAAGEPLPLTQEQIALRGHAIEARIYAEDTQKGFLPSTGHLDHLRFPSENPALRIETGVTEGDEVSPFYDPMLAKIVVHGADRETALRRLRMALAATEIVGPETNLGFLTRIAQDPDFAAGSIDTGFVAVASERLLALSEAENGWFIAVASLWLLCRQRQQALVAAEQSADRYSPWHRVDGWRLNDEARQILRFRLGEQVVEVDARVDGTGYLLQIGADRAIAAAEIQPNGQLAVWLNDEACHLRVVERADQLHLFSPKGHRRIDRLDPLTLAETEDEADDVLTAPMPGKIIRQPIAAGDRVKRGTPLLVLEAMKMEHAITAPSDGRVVRLRYAEGDQVEEGAILVDFEAQSDG